MSYVKGNAVLIIYIIIYLIISTTVISQERENRLLPDWTDA